MKEFISQNWMFIVYLGVAILEVVTLLIFKKRPQIVDNSLLVHLTEWILAAESKYKSGSDKLDYVLDEARKYLGDKFVKKDIVAIVEFLLTLPEKKEGK